MGLFSAALTDQINQIAAKSNEANETVAAVNTRSMNDELNLMSKKVMDYFKDSPAILISTKEQLHNYIDKCIENGYAGIDTETTGLDRIHDHIVGASLYTPGEPECYIPMKHLVPIFDTPYKNQLSYEEVSEEFERLVTGKVKLIFANADFDLAMIYKDLKVDLIPAFYYDVITAWRCLREDEKDNTLKGLYAKYVKKGQIDPQKFSDFFSPKLFPNCKPAVAALYAANDAKITYELFLWQLPYVTKSNAKCQKHHLEKIADLIWNIEFPMVAVCADLHRRGMFLDDSIATPLHDKYTSALHKDEAELAKLVQELIDTKDIASNRNRPFRSGSDFNPNSTPHVKYLINNLLGSTAKTTSKDVLKEINKPATKAVLKVRGDVKLLSTYVDKLPKVVAGDRRVHATFKSIGADCVTGDTLIPTTKGYFLLKDLCESRNCKEGELTECDPIEIVNMNQQVETATHVIRFTNTPTIKVTTEYGFVIEGTPNHPVMVSKYHAKDQIYANSKLLHTFWNNRRFKNLEDLEVGDWIEFPCNYSVCPKEYVPTNFILHPPYQSSRTTAKMPEFYTEEFAEFLGMYHADGSAALREGTFTIALSNRHEDVIHRFEELGMNLFNVPASHYTAQAAINEIETYLNCIQIKDIDRILSHGKRNKRIPEAIWRSPSSVINAYIKGLTLDSSVCRDGSGRANFAISVFNVDDANLIRVHLASQGILCYIAWNDNDGGFKSPSLTFNPDNYMLFRDKIGFIESRKYMDTEPNAKGKYCSRRINDSFRLKVKSIEYSTNTVYDLHVPETHSFISNGLISHNTGRMASSDPNMQNIPSHATDIRHMFRATPEQDVLIDLTKCIDQETQIAKIKHSKYSKVRTEEGLTSLKNLVQGQKFWFKLTTDEASTSVESIEFDKGEAILSFSIVSVQGSQTKLEVKNPAFVVMNSDFSQQEPRLTATVSGCRQLIDAFRNNRDVYATISSIALGFPYEECLEFNPITGEQQPEGKERRSVGKVLNLGITYGMSVQSISESLFGTRDDMTDEQKLKEAQKIQDSLMKGFPDLARAISDAQKKAATLGYTETILGRRRHHPNMQLPRFEFEPMDGYVNPDIDPLDPKSLENKEQIPKRLVDSLTKEFNSYKWYGKIVKRTKELAKQKIKVINNSYKIEEASRQVFNAIIQGSAADLTKMAMLRLEHDDQWKELGGRFLLPIHDELMCEVPIENVKEGAETLARCMCEAGDFLPFKLSTDVEVNFRWYGLPVEVIMEKEKPASLDWDNLSKSNIEWLQCMVTENEYNMPVLPEPDGSKPQGVRARGVNGTITDDLKEAVKSYMNRYQLKTDQEFLDHIEAKVIRGVY